MYKKLMTFKSLKKIKTHVITVRSRMRCILPQSVDQVWIRTLLIRPHIVIKAYIGVLVSGLEMCKRHSGWDWKTKPQIYCRKYRKLYLLQKVVSRPTCFIWSPAHQPLGSATGTTAQGPYDF